MINSRSLQLSGDNKGLTTDQNRKPFVSANTKTIVSLIPRAIQNLIDVNQLPAARIDGENSSANCYARF